MSTPIEALVKQLIMEDDVPSKQKTVAEINSQAKAKGIFLSSIHDVYMARGKGQGKLFTVPARIRIDNNNDECYSLPKI